MTPWWWRAHIAALALALVAAVVELVTEEIPNAIVVAALVAGVVVCIGDRAYGGHLLGFAIASVPMLYLWRREIAGGGAVKLFSALGLLLGWRDALFLWAFMACTLVVGVLRRRSDERAEIPSAPVMLVGVGILTWWSSR